jgi:hypothetical protein
MSIVNWLKFLDRVSLGAVAEDNPNECLSEALRWLLLWLLDLERSWGKGSEMLGQPLRSGS